MNRVSIALVALAVVVTAGCEDFRLTDHTVMKGPRPPEVIQMPAVDLQRNEVIDIWKVASTDWPSVYCALELGSNGRFIWTALDDLNCTISATSGGQSIALGSATDKWFIDGAVGMATVKLRNWQQGDLIDYTFGVHLRRVGSNPDA